MRVTLETLAAIYRLSKHLIFADDDPSDAEIEKIVKFLSNFEGLDVNAQQQIVEYGTEHLDDTQAVKLIAALDDDAKQEVANLFAQIVLADGELTEDEKKLYWQIQELCGLPDAQDEDTSENTAPASDGNDAIIPAFLVVNYDGFTSVQQSENEDWDTLGDELSAWIGADGRVEVVRYTRPLNALSEQLGLNGRHLVFMVARNGYACTVGDNMPATLLYGGGYPIMGNIVFALETDKGYEIEGITSRGLLSKVFNAVDGAVDGLLRTE